ASPSPTDWVLPASGIAATLRSPTWGPTHWLFELLKAHRQECRGTTGSRCFVLVVRRGGIEGERQLFCGSEYLRTSVRGKDVRKIVLQVALLMAPDGIGTAMRWTLLSARTRRCCCCI